MGVPVNWVMWMIQIHVNGGVAACQENESWLSTTEKKGMEVRHDKRDSLTLNVPSLCLDTIRCVFFRMLH